MRFVGSTLFWLNDMGKRALAFLAKCSRGWGVLSNKTSFFPRSDLEDDRG